MAEEGLTAGGLRRTVAELVDEEPESITDEMNLFEVGLDSIVLMQLVGRWRRAGADIDFAELAQQPTIGAWATLLRQKAGVTPADGPVADQDPVGTGPEEHADGLFPLALMQHAYWVGRGEHQQFGGVAAHLYVEFDGTGVQPQRLERAIERLVAHHEMLRVRITDNGEQEILARPGWGGLTVHDLRETDAAQTERRLTHTRETLSHQLLDIENGEVFSTALSLLPDGRTRLHVDVDMVAADAVSYRVILADLARLYGDPDVRLPPIGYGYRRYLSARPESRRAAASRAAEFWQRRLPDLPGAPELPLVPAGSTARAGRRAFLLPPHLRAALTRAARSRGVTPAMTVTTAFAEVLGAWSAEPRFLLNVPIFDREQVHPDIDRVVGDFTSSVLLEVDLTESVTFAERVRRVQDRLHADTTHAGYSGVEVLRDLSRRNGEQVIAPVVFTSGLNLGELFDEAVRRHFGDPVWIISQGPQVLLDAQVTEVDGGLLVNWDVRENEFAPGVIDAMFAAFEHLVRLAAEDGAAWDAPVGDLRPEGQRAVRARVNDTTVPSTPRLLHEDFFALSRRAPDAPALLGDAAGPLSYAELAQRALRVAAALRACGVDRGDAVGVTLPKGPDQIVAVLGVLAAGGTYVPIGVEQPAARAERIAGLAGLRVVVTEEAGPGRLAPAAALAGYEPLAGPCSCDPEQAAYLLFTSGSTGEPKGVEVAHRAAMNTIDDLVERFELGSSDRTLGVSALDFDLSVFDVFAPLSVGGAVVVVDEDGRRDAQRWAGLIRESGVTVLNCVPALLDMILTAGVALGRSLRLVLLGGDRVGADLPGRLVEAVPGCRFAGLGGTTETAIHSTVCEVGPVPPEWTSVPYGRPLRNVCLRVVDALGRDVPDWVPGELWIGGAGVALRYRGDPERTADRFVLHEGQRWYRTGDRARYWPDGTVEFLGRRDNQVKLRGMRIELGEVEAALLADPQVHSAVAMVRRSATPALVGAVVPAAVVPAADADPEQIREGLRERVPPYMIPERLLVLGDLPLTRNGKVDRRALELRAEQAWARDTGTGRVAPRSTLERAITRIWASVLPVGDTGRIGVTDSLFALGGDSVLATAIVARLRSELDIPAVSVRMLFAAPTIAGLAERILATEQTPARLERVAEIFLEIDALSGDEVDAELGEAVTGR